MRVLEQPYALMRRGIKWPKIMVLDRNEEAPEGLPYIRSDGKTSDLILVYRLLIPMLAEKYTIYDWEEIYKSVTGETFRPLKINGWSWSPNNGGGVKRNFYGLNEGKSAPEEMTLQDLARDIDTYVDLNVIRSIKLMPVWMDNIAEAVRINVTNSYAWTDGYNKKTGICSGYLTRVHDPRVLMIVDISGSIPEGVSAGLLTILHTMVDVTHADLIVTGGTSVFYESKELRNVSADDIRRKISRSNESRMFNDILMSRDMQYDTVICFGDSDEPTIREDVRRKLENMRKVKRLMSFFIGQYDRYGGFYINGAGYARWIKDHNNPNVIIEHYTDWAKMFKRTYW